MERFIPRSIDPLRPDEVDELAGFLTAGFGPCTKGEPHSPEVLHWKYFDPCGHEDLPRSYVARKAGAIIGHVGITPTSFVTPDGLVPTLHLIDWIGSSGNLGIGAALMRHVHELTPTQYAVGASVAGRRSLDREHYKRIDDIPVFRKILRPGYHLRGAKTRNARAFAGSAYSAIRIASRREKPPVRQFELIRVEAFDEEVESITRDSNTPTATRRDSARLNHLLRHPAHCLEGFQIRESGRICGFAVISIVTNGRLRIGRIVECLLDRNEHSGEAIGALTRLLRDRRVDAVFGCASTPWTASAYRGRGFDEVHRLECRLRDPSGLIPRTNPFHFTYLEADYSYLP